MLAVIPGCSDPSLRESRQRHSLQFGRETLFKSLRIDNEHLYRPNPLTNSRLSRYHSLSLLFGADLGFHAEWLRDEP
jgi:hypothetical protein